MTKKEKATSRVKRASSAKVKPTKGAAERRPTIRDVSRLAGVSRMTVSRTLSDPARVQASTRDLVMRAVTRLGYVPDRAAGSLSTGRTGFIALLMPTLTNANFSSIAHGVTEVVRRAGYQVLIGYTSYSAAEEERQIQSLLARRPEAIILASTSHNRSVSNTLFNAGIPIVEIAELPAQPIGHVVGFSNRAVGRKAARYLLEAGCERIAAIGCSSDGDVRDARGEERLRGFSEELIAAGVREPVVLRQGDAPVSYSHGAHALAFLNRRIPDIQAVFAVSDMSAIGVMMECRRRGIDIPGQLSLVGFGDFDIASEVVPALTTVRADFKDMGVRTGELILQLLTGSPPAKPTVIDVGISLVERSSVARRGTAP